ncbi:MAG: TIGR04282 family arsenosugar biosynthesis glycosyltransferase [Gammaproteobacteria bacterium]|nr:TIGR04282 family arsenosugar biosynthesis glycosyltransferase [Gammaproteobacteria bacterium]
MKTRLIPHLGEVGAARLAHELLVRTLTTVSSADFPVQILCVDGAVDGFELGGVVDPMQWRVIPQGSGDLGARMAEVFWLVSMRQRHVVLVGSDIPALSAEILGEARRALQSGVDVVIGPASDGGYYLIGLSGHHPALFQEIQWSTPAVFAQTMTRINSLGLSVHVLPECWDLDREEDFNRWQELKRNAS